MKGYLTMTRAVIDVQVMTRSKRSIIYLTFIIYFIPMCGCFFVSISLMFNPLGNVLGLVLASVAVVAGRVTNGAVLVRVTDAGLAETVELALPGVDVKEDGVGKGDEEADQGDGHGDVVALVVGEEAGQGGEEGAARDGGDDPGGAALGVAAETADGEGEDGGEDAGLEEEDQGEHGDTPLALDAHGQGDEDHDARHEDHEDLAGLEVHHEAGGGEAANGEQGLGDGVAVRGGCVVDAGALGGVADEVGGDADLGADVAELGGDTKEEAVLLLQGLVLVTSEVGGLLGLQLHVGVGDLGDLGEVEDNGEQEDEGGDSEVGPLHLG